MTYKEYVHNKITKTIFWPCTNKKQFSDNKDLTYSRIILKSLTLT